jgi:hypothetical protein
MDTSLTVQHVHEYIWFWTQLQGIQLDEHVDDTITWDTTTNGEYSSTAAYTAHFFGAAATNMNKLVWKTWAPPKIKFFVLFGWPFKVGFGWRIILSEGV